MKIETLEVAGIGPAVRALRNPYSNWSLSDTKHGMIGPKDMHLSDRLAKSGGSHSKHLRMIQVWAEIWAPRYWWTEFDTYRQGVERLSTSTMHTLTKTQLTRENFEWSGNVDDLTGMISSLNELIEEYRQADRAGTPSDRELAFRVLKQSLPESFIQRRTVMASYQALRHMYEDRAGHRLREWQTFRAWCETLPEAWMITGQVPEFKVYDELHDD